MPLTIDSHLLQARFKDYTTTVSERATKNFAAALHDANSVYFDDLRPDKIVAPPTFPVALTWPIIAHLNDFLEGVSFPQNVLPTIVHTGEQLILHHPVSPGTSLLIRTKIVALLPHKNGTQLFLRFEAFDKENMPVFTEITGALLRNVSCTGPCGGKENLPAPPVMPPEPSLLWKKALFIDPLLPYVYDGCTDIVFPIHTSRRFARQVGLPDILLQGTATLGLVVREIVSTELKSRPQAVQVIQARFSGMIFPGTEIRLHLFRGKEKQALRDFHFIVLDGDNQAVIKEGFLRAGG